MTEREKMTNGMVYDPCNEQLVKDRETAKNLCYDYNNLRPSLQEERYQTLCKLIGKAGKFILIEQPFYCDYGYNIEVGDNFYVNHNCVILDCAKVTFGNDVFVAPNCGFYTATHPIDSEARNQFIEFAKPIKIGNSVWIGGNTVVLPGVTIGDDVVIGAGSVVVKDIPSGVVAVGNPCRVIRNITAEDKLKYKEFIK